VRHFTIHPSMRFWENFEKKTQFRDILLDIMSRKCDNINR
jgi:hypothetical protein